MAAKMLSKHFSEAEFHCQCGRAECDATPMKGAFIYKLELLRVRWGKPMTPTSGARCKWHNKKEGGAPRSQHLSGNAVDFYLTSAAERDALVALAEEMGWLGIGVGKGRSYLVHLDDRRTPARWVY